MPSKHTYESLDRISELANLREAILDALFLLERGYNREKVRDFVGDKYRLDKALRSVIYRCIHTSNWISSIKAKIVHPWQIRNKYIVIDFLNVLGTTISAISGGLIVKSLDGFFRDVSELHASILTHPKVYEATEIIINTVSTLTLSSVIFLLEEKVSHSGDFAAFIRRRMSEAGINGTAKTCRTVNSDIMKSSYIVATSDAVIMSHVEYLIDLAGLVLSKVLEPNYCLIDLQDLVWSY